MTAEETRQALNNLQRETTAVKQQMGELEQKLTELRERATKLWLENDSNLDERKNNETDFDVDVAVGPSAV